VVVAVIAVRVVEVIARQVVGVVTVRDGFVTASRPVFVRSVVRAARMTGRAPPRIGGPHLEPMLVHVALVRMMKVAVVQIVGVTGVAHRSVPAARAVSMPVTLVNLVTLLTHGPPSTWLSEYSNRSA
jgi:hypothetical protein